MPTTYEERKIKADLLRQVLVQHNRIPNVNQKNIVLGRLNSYVNGGYNNIDEFFRDANHIVGYKIFTPSDMQFFNTNWNIQQQAIEKREKDKKDKEATAESEKKKKEGEQIYDQKSKRVEELEREYEKLETELKGETTPKNSAENSTTNNNSKEIPIPPSGPKTKQETEAEEAAKEAQTKYEEARNAPKKRMTFEQRAAEHKKLKELRQKIRTTKIELKRAKIKAELLDEKSPASIARAKAKLNEKEREKKHEEAAKKAQDTNNGDYTSSFQGTPFWYGGPYGEIQSLAERAKAESLAEYKDYPYERIADLSPLQEVASSEAMNEIQNKEYEDLFNNSKRFMTEATDTPAYQDIDNYMNPYQERVLDTLEKRMNRNLYENILPNLNSNYISKGMYNSGGRETAQARAIRDMQEAYASEAGGLLARGYEGALGTSQADLGRKMSGAQGLHNLKSNELEDRLSNIDILNTLGTRQQQQEQANLNNQYNDWVQEMNYPHRQTARYSEILRGMQPSLNTESYTMTPGVPPISPYQQMGGIGMQLASGMMQQRHAKGGHVRAKYALGGVAMLPEEQDYNYRLQQARDFMDKPGANPLWSYIGRMGAGLASSKNPNFMGALGEASAPAYDAMQGAITQNQQRQMHALDFTKLLADSKRSSEERLYRRNLEEEERAFRKAMASQPEITEDWKLDSLGNPITATKINKRIAGFRRSSITGDESAMPTAISEQPLSEEFQTPIQQAPQNNIMLKKSTITSPYEEKAKIDQRVKRDEERIGRILQAGDVADEQIPKLKAIKELSNKVGTTQILGNELEPDTANAINALDPKSRANREYLLTEITDLKRSIVNEAKGNPSDKEYKILANAVAHYGNSPEGNIKIANAALAVKTRKSMNKKFTQDMLENGYTATSIEQAINEFDNKFPPIEADATVNEANLEITPYDFASGKIAPPQGKTINTRVGPMSIEQLEQIAMQAQ